MATATAPSRDRHVPQPKLRADQLPAEKPSKKHKPRTKNRPKKDEGHLFSVFIILVVGIAAIGFVVLAQRNAIIKYSLEAEALKDRIAESVVVSNNLQSQLAIMAASPQLQRTAVEDLEMAAAENVAFIQSDQVVTAEELESALVFLDSQKSQILSYREVLAVEAAERLALAPSTDVGVETIPVSQVEEIIDAEVPAATQPPASHLLPVVEVTPASSAGVDSLIIASGE